MEKPSQRSKASRGVLADWPTNSRQSSTSAKSSRQSSRKRPTAAKKESAKSSGRGSRGPHRNRRQELLRRMGVSEESLASSPQISPLLRQNSIRPERMVEILRCDTTPEAAIFVQVWDKLTPAARSLAGVEAMALSAGMTPRRLWEAFCGAALVQSKESVGLAIAMALPEVMGVTVKEAKKAKGHFAREHLFKAARVLPVPKGSTTIIRVNEPAKELEDGDDDDLNSAGMLEPADGELMKFAKVMNSKALPAPKPTETVENEDEDDEEEGE